MQETPEKTAEPAPDRAVPPAGRRALLNNQAVAGAAIVVAALAAYHNSFGGPFMFDDIPSIVDNRTITHLWPLWEPLSPTRGFGLTVSGRPLLNLTLAVNYAISGQEVWSYHALNLLIHALAGLTLFGLVRRTLLLPCRSLLAGDSGTGRLIPSPASRLLQENAACIAFVTALWWTVHPLQTESVTYVVQRAESLVGLFYLLTLYCFARGVGRVSDPSSRPVKDRSYLTWLAGSVAACLLGVGCKEVIVTAPVVVLLYDRTFAAGSFREAWRRRRWFYARLVATWLPLAWLVVSAGGDRGGTFRFTAAAFGNYWLTQFEAITRYLQLSLWPNPLVFEYGFFKVERFSQVLPYALLVLALVAATLWALARKPVLGFLGASFFLILAPTSVIPGLIQVIVEHRMYLSLAAVLVLVTGAMTLWWGRRGLAACAVAALICGGLTIRRNADYQTELGFWIDSVQKRPDSAPAQCNLGVAWYKAGNLPEALLHFERSLQLESESVQTHYNMGLALDKSNRVEEALAHYAEAVRIVPNFAPAHAEWGAELIKLGRMEEAMKHLRVALAREPGMAEVHNSLGMALAGLGRLPEAITAYEMALKLKPDLADLHFNLGIALAGSGRTAEALTHYHEAVRLNPRHAEARLNLGILLGQAGRGEESLLQLREAVRLKPALAEAHANLGIALAMAGREEEAVGSYETALRLRPDYAVAHYNLGNALVQLQRWPDAKQHFAEAVRLAPGFEAARAMLEQLEAAPGVK